MIKLIHLTDPHLTKPGNRVYGSDPLVQFKAAIESINQLHSDADLCVITGDLAHTAEDSAYKALKESLDMLIPPYYLVVGNHDAREKVKNTFSQFNTMKDDFFQYTLDKNDTQFVFLDTIKTGTHAGAYCDERLQWLEETLSTSLAKNIYLFAHHPPFKIGLPTMDAISIDVAASKKMASVIQQYQSVKHLFFGHVHRPIHGQWNGISFSTLRGTNHQVWLDFTAKDQIPGSFEPPAYAIALLEDEQIVIHNHDFMDTSAKFMMGSWQWEQWHKDNQV